MDINVDYAQITDKGERDINEDCIGHMKKDDWDVFILADGLGGHGLGDLASQFVVEKLEVALQEGEGLDTSIRYVQDALLNEQKIHGYYGKMKTTLTLLSIKNNIIEFVHIGDSRIYHFHKNKVAKRTLDHSVCQKLVEANMIREKDIRNHPDRSKLLKVMGEVWKEDPLHINEATYCLNDAFILCSDGFWENITEKEMTHCLKKSSSATSWLNKMCEIALKRGRGTNMDNYSCIAIILK